MISSQPPVDVKIISFDYMMLLIKEYKNSFYPERDIAKRLEVVLDPANHEKVKGIFDTIKAGALADQTEIYYKTYNPYDRLLCHNIGQYLGYSTVRTEKRMYKYVGCHEYDWEYDPYDTTYCACKNVPKKFKKRGISHIKLDYDDPQEEVLENHFYALPRTAIVGVTLKKIE